MEKKVRVRYAPSPTGPQHIGGIRTALFNYLFAKKHNGQFIVRIEDTDQTRFVEGSEEYLFKALDWLNIVEDESIRKGGQFAPYKQSLRKDIYKKYAQELIDTNKAYYAFDTPEEIEEMRQRLREARVPAPQYNSISRDSMKNSLTLPDQEVQRRLDSGEPYVIRLKTPVKEQIIFHDVVRGNMKVESSTLDDKVILKSDGLPTYHLANVIDDHLMDITHVIRGEEWLPSTPIHILLYQAFGWEEPKFAHLPLLLKPNGVGKLSKRSSEEDGYPVFPMNWENKDKSEKFIGFKEEGYFPEAVINFLALLGWSPGNNDEIFSFEELQKKFSLERINKSGVKFDIKKAQWFNQQYLRKKPLDEILAFFKSKIKENKYSDSQIKQIIDLVLDRAVFLEDIIQEVKIFYHKPTDYQLDKLKDPQNLLSTDILEEFKAQISNEKNFDAANIKHLIVTLSEKYKFKLGALMPYIRVVLTGVKAGPDLMTMMEILGKEEIIFRIDTFKNL